MPELWIVVCTELHAGFGVFNNRDRALFAAAEMTASDRDGCTYLPVQLISLDGSRPQDESDKSGGHNVGQYL